MGRHVRDELRRFISSFPLPRDRGRGPGACPARGTEHHPGSLSSTTDDVVQQQQQQFQRRGNFFVASHRIALLLSLPVPIQAPVAILAAKLRCKGGGNLGEGLLTVQPDSHRRSGPGPVR